MSILFSLVSLCVTLRGRRPSRSAESATEQSASLSATNFSSGPTSFTRPITSAATAAFSFASLSSVSWNFGIVSYSVSAG